MARFTFADHGELGKRFVVKLLHAEMSADARLVDRMRVEAQTLAKLRHPSIVDVVDFGATPDGRPYLVMERLTGTTLADEVRQRGALGVGEALALIRQLLSALAAAHEIGIIHRDVKLSNLFLHHAAERAPVLKVLDFGSPKCSMVRPAPLPNRCDFRPRRALSSERRASRTRSLGRKGVDHRADIYATGVVLYHLLCGRGPWQDLRRHADILTRSSASASILPLVRRNRSRRARLDRAARALRIARGSVR
jgi:serine/threonine-protein kinase